MEATKTVVCKLDCTKEEFEKLIQHNADYVASVNLRELAQGGWAAVNQPDVGVDCLHETTYKPLPLRRGS